MTIENGYLLHNANANDKTQPAFTLHNHFRRPYNLQCTFIIHILLAHFWPARYPHRHNIHRREWAVLSIFGKNVALLSLNKIQRKYYYIIINNIVGAIASFYLCHPKSLTMKIIHTRRKERRRKNDNRIISLSHQSCWGILGILLPKSLHYFPFFASIIPGIYRKYQHKYHSFSLLQMNFTTLQIVLISDFFYTSNSNYYKFSENVFSSTHHLRAL